MSCGIGHRYGLDLTWLWLWCRTAATAPIRLLAWEPPYVLGAALKSKKRKEKKPGLEGNAFSAKPDRVSSLGLSLLSWKIGFGFSLGSLAGSAVHFLIQLLPCGKVPLTLDLSSSLGLLLQPTKLLALKGRAWLEQTDCRRRWLGGALLLWGDIAPPTLTRPAHDPP